MFYNIFEKQKSRPFNHLIAAQSAAHDFVLAAWDNGLNTMVQTVDDSGRIITEFKMIEVVH